MAPLDIKLGRDLWRVKSQALAIALVMAFGVLLLVMMDGLVNSLSETRRAYYERYRLAQVFAPVKRAPRHKLHSIEQWPEIAAVEGRISAGALIDIPGSTVPVYAQAVSLPDYRSPRLNDVYLSEGRALNPSHRDEILLLEGFARAHGIAPGDSLAATMNGTRRRFDVVGLAQAPEFLYTTAPGEMVPDDKRFAVIWMSEKALEAAFDLDGAFNELLVTLGRDGQQKSVINKLDRLLEPYGAIGAYGLDQHMSNRFIEEEIHGLQASRRTVPPVFLFVAAFLLYIVVSRMVQAERDQIGLLKAFGYTSWEISVHYARFVMVIALAGALAGCALGVISGRALSGVYQQYYKFPFLVFRVDWTVFLTGLVTSLTVACAGAALVLRRVFQLAPAEAMRPPTPPDFSHTLQFGPRLRNILDQPTRMVLRALIRQPVRSLLSVLGIALGMALSGAMLNVLSAFDSTMEVHFEWVDRSDARVSFIEPLNQQALFALARLPGVTAVEPVRDVPVIFRAGRAEYRGTLTALIPEPELYRPLDRHRQPVFIRSDGLILSRALANELQITAGDSLRLDVREGRRPTLELPVVGLADSLMGAPAYISLSALNRALKEPFSASSAYLRISAPMAGHVYHQLKHMPVVAGVSLREQSRQAMQTMMDSGAGAMRYVMMLIAGVITFGIVYNSTRIAFAERSRDLASLRVVGLSRAEVGFVLLGELGVIILLSLPLGVVLGYGLSYAIAAGFSTDLYRVPTNFIAEAYGLAALAVLLAAFVSGWLVKRDINRLDLVGALKTRE